MFQSWVKSFLLVFQEIRYNSTMNRWGKIHCCNNRYKLSTVIEENHVWCEYGIKKGIESYNDNQAAISIAYNSAFHGRTKHFNVKLFSKDTCINIDMWSFFTIKVMSRLLKFSPRPFPSVSLSFFFRMKVRIFRS